MLHLTWLRSSRCPCRAAVDVKEELCSLTVQNLYSHFLFFYANVKFRIFCCVYFVTDCHRVRPVAPTNNAKKKMKFQNFDFSKISNFSKMSWFLHFTLHIDITRSHISSRGGNWPAKRRTNYAKRRTNSERRRNDTAKRRSDTAQRRTNSAKRRTNYSQRISNIAFATSESRLPPLNRVCPLWIACATSESRVPPLNRVCHLWIAFATFASRLPALNRVYHLWIVFATFESRLPPLNVRFCKNKRQGASNSRFLCVCFFQNMS